MTSLGRKSLVTTPTLKHLLDMVYAAKNEIIIISPWIKSTTLQKIIKATKPKANIRWKVLTRGDHEDFCLGASDIDAFKRMIEDSSFDLRSIKQLHAKIYIVDGNLSLVTSANLTVSGMEINKEAGIASTDPNDAHELIKEFDVWFDQATLLDKSWLKKERQKLLEFQEQEPVEPEIPFDPEDYHHPKTDGQEKINGKYRELPLPTAWIPTLDSLKEAEIPINHDHFAVNNLIMSAANFLEYVGTVSKGERFQRFLVSWLVHKQTLETIANDKITRERVSQAIGKRTDAGNIWISAEGENFIKQLSSLLNDIVGKADLRVSNVLSSAESQPSGLSDLDLCQFVCGMVEKRLVVGNYYAKITPTNQLLICNKEIYTILKELDRIFHADYQEFLDLEKFCHLGELENISDAWFCSDFKVFQNLYITKNLKIGSRKWGIEKRMRAVAWELADRIGYYHWHFSEMREALDFLFPAKYGQTTVRHVNARISDAPDKFHHAGSKGIWQLSDLGDGYHNNKEAVVSIFLRFVNSPLSYKDIIKELRGMGRRVNEGSIYALLDRDVAFTNIGQGTFRLRDDFHIN